jgi:hypothetical protein
MSKAEMTRRVALGAVGAFVVAPTLLVRGALAHSHAAVGGIHVDVTPLLENSGQPTAGWVAQEMPAALAQAGVAPPASLRIDYVMLGPNTGGVGPAGASLDQILGEATVGGVARPVRASVSYFSSPVDQTMIEQSNHDRVSQLVQALAYWVARGY